MKKTDLAKYAGNKIYALCRRSGWMFKDIDCLTIYRITERGTLRYVGETMSCVANQSQHKEMLEVTKGQYVTGRPTAENINEKDILDLIK